MTPSHNRSRRRDLHFTAKPMSVTNLKPGFLCGIDAEFVALSKEETEIGSDGSRIVLRPSRLSLARVSVLRGDDGPDDCVPFIDDWISTTDTIVDYLTEFSGIKLGDLDPISSLHPLVPLKVQQW